MPSPICLEAAADPVEAAAQLHSRLLVAREIGSAYGHGVLPDWVKAAQEPAPTTLGGAAAAGINAVPSPTQLAQEHGPAIKAVGDKAIGAAGNAAGGIGSAVGGALDSVEGTLRPPLQAGVQRLGLAPHLPKSNSNPSDPLGALGNAVRPGLIGAAAGAGLGLLGGLTGKKKRPLSGLLYGGLMGGLAGGAGGYLYDRVAGSPPKDQPSPEQVAQSHEHLQAMTPGVGTDTVAGLTDKGFWAPGGPAGQRANHLPGDIAAGAGGGAVLGYGAGRALQSRTNAGILNSPGQKFEEVTRGAPAAPKEPGPVTQTKTTIKSPEVPRTAHQGGMRGLVRGGGAGAVLYPLAQLGLAAHQHGGKVQAGASPQQAADDLQRTVQYASTLPPAQNPQVQTQRQQLLTQATALQSQLRAHQGPIDEGLRQRIAQLDAQLNQYGLIQVQPAGR